MTTNKEWINNIKNCQKEIMAVLKKNNCELIADDFLNVIIRDVKTMKDETDLMYENIKRKKSDTTTTTTKD